MAKERHPPGLYVLFFTEMWERFGFYSMLAMFTLYLKDDKSGFGWTAAEATRLYSTYLTCVYASPLIGGWIADKKLGYRNSVLIGGLIFMAGYWLLSIHAIAAVYTALVCLVVANAFFKPNVSAMVGYLYREGSPLKDRAYNVFYMGINIGALLAPINAEIMKEAFGFNVAFAVAGFGMIASVLILWSFRRFIEGAEKGGQVPEPSGTNTPLADPPRPNPMEAVPESKRILALIVIFLIVIVFWMVFNQNGSTLTYWADDNTDWKVSGIISNAINPFWVVTLTFPVVGLWSWLNRRNMEPSTPTKMTFGMFLCAGSFALLCIAARTGESQTITEEMLKTGDFRLTDRSLGFLKEEGVPPEVLDELNSKDSTGKFNIKGRKFSTDRTFEDAWNTIKQSLEEDVQSAKADLEIHQDRDKALQEQIKQAQDEGAAPEKIASLKEELKRHRAGKKALQETLQRAEKDAKALKDMDIKKGELPALGDRGADGNKEFAEALEQVIKDAKGLSPEGAEKVRRWKNRAFSGKEKFDVALARRSILGIEDAAQYGPVIEKRSYLFKVSPLWLILAYMVVTLAELMLSPMGLSLVSKVAPTRLRGVMMGGWFVATAIGSALTMIGVYWERWLQSTFFAVLGGMALVMAFVLLALLRPLKKAMPGA